MFTDMGRAARLAGVASVAVPYQLAANAVAAIAAGKAVNTQIRLYFDAI